MPLPRDLAWSELDGVSDEVGDDLAQTKRVANELIRDVRFHIIRKVKVVLGGTDDEGLEDAKDSLTEGVGDCFHGHATSLNFNSVIESRG